MGLPRLVLLVYFVEVVARGFGEREGASSALEDGVVEGVHLRRTEEHLKIFRPTQILGPNMNPMYYPPVLPLRDATGYTDVETLPEAWVKDRSKEYTAWLDLLKAKKPKAVTHEEQVSDAVQKCVTSVSDMWVTAATIADDREWELAAFFRAISLEVSPKLCELPACRAALPICRAMPCCGSPQVSTLYPVSKLFRTS